MGIKERQGREREAVHRAILDAARELFVSEGYQNVSIRKIAERIEYSPAAIYGYFPSKDDIFFALAEEGFRLLASPEGLSELETLEPLDRIRAIFWRMYQFSNEHPQYFALMFSERAVPRITRELAADRFAYAREVKTRLIGHVQLAIDAGELPRTVNPIVTFRLLTMGLVGVAMMRLSDRLAPNENADALARDVIEVMLAGLRSGVALHASTFYCPLDENEVDRSVPDSVPSAETPAMRSPQ
jgi:AcrR family transcriptional regulator